MRFARAAAVSTTLRLQVSVVTETYPPEVNRVALRLERLVEGLRGRGHKVSLVRRRRERGESADDGGNGLVMLVRGADRSVDAASIRGNERALCVPGRGDQRTPGGRRAAGPDRASRDDLDDPHHPTRTLQLAAPVLPSRSGRYADLGRNGSVSRQHGVQRQGL